MILSAEIMAIALNDVTNQPLALQAAALAVVSLGITIGVYGVVALIVKMDDIGLHLSERRNAGSRALGRGLVKAMPVVLDLLTKIGTAAMLWVGGGILVHGLEHFHIGGVAELVEGFSHWAGAFPVVGPVTGWFAFALGSAALGLIVGAVIVGVLHLIPKRTKAA
jgi:predicted DNA repair protein MutK